MLGGLIISGIGAVVGPILVNNLKKYIAKETFEIVGFVVLSSAAVEAQDKRIAQYQQMAPKACIYYCNNKYMSKKNSEYNKLKEKYYKCIGSSGLNNKKCTRMKDELDNRKQDIDSWMKELLI